MHALHEPVARASILLKKLWQVTWQLEDLRQALYGIVLIIVKKIMSVCRLLDNKNEAERCGVKVKGKNPTNLK